MKNPLHFLTTIAVALLIFVTGYNAGQSSVRRTTSAYSVSNQQKGNTYNIDFTLFWDTWKALEQQYVDPKKLDPKTLYYGAIKGMVASLDDPYTFFLTPEENKQSKDDLGGKFEGIGAELGLKNGRIVVVAPLKDSPAEKAGVQAGEYVLKVDGKSTDNWTLIQAVQKIRGKGGTTVTLTLFSNSKEKEVKIVRGTIKVESTSLKIQDKTAILKLTQFGDHTNDEWDREVEKIVAGQEKGTITSMVLDLRNNPGGFLQSAVYVSSEFLPVGKTVVNQEYNKEETQVYKVERAGKLLKIPVVVLINGGSASASEIVAGALRDNKRATLVGEKSFGKGSVQVALDLKQHAGIHITIAKWKLPNGDWIHGKGIEPDIKVENKVDEDNTLTDKTDTQLQKALETVRKLK